jgi:hypothetical protein
VPSDDDIRDPRAFRWVEAGVSGLAREREWDATAIVELPSLRGESVGELDYRLLGDGSLVGQVPPEALTELAAGLELDPPYAARAVRQSELEWLVGAVKLESDVVDLPQDVPAQTLEVAIPPEGAERMVIVDGEILGEEPVGLVGDAVSELERRGRERFQAFVARADRVEDGRWDLTIDPL